MPTILGGLAQTTDQYKHLVARALKEQLPLAQVDYRGFQSKVFSLSPTMRSRLAVLADERFDGDVKAAFASLAAAGIAAEVEAAERRNRLAKQARVKLLFEPKSDLQAQFFDMASKAILDGSIVFAEGSTGIGKGRALSAIALIKARVDGFIVVASPTVATMEQIYAEAQSINSGDTAMAILPGASEFVDDLMLTDYLEDTDTPGLEPVRQWLSEGAKPLRPQRPLVQSIGADAAWLREDLMALTDGIDGFDADAFTLRHEIGADSHARNLVRGIRAVAKNGAKVVFCTHAMLALAQKTQWRVMPAPTMLIIDEAHQFEAAVSLVSSSKVSIHTLKSSLARTRREQKLGPRSTIAIAHAKAVELSKYLNAMNYEGTIGLEDLPPAIRQALLEKTDPLQKLLGSAPCASVPMANHYARALALIVARLRALASPGRLPESSEIAYVTYSNVRRFPSLIAGPASVASQLASIWSKATDGAVLASATLYTPSSTGDLRCEYLRTILNAPQGRTVMAMPVIDPSIYRIPTMHIPSKATAVRLRPPAELPKDAWFQAIADTLVEHVLPASSGGTMLLCTSYADIDGIAAQLKARSLDRTVVAMERGRSFSISRGDFTQAALNGERPILLALGPAWTGVDLSMPDLPAEDDRLLTALVISKLPVGLNDSNTMLSRIKRMGMHAVTQEALLTLKQGLGRLIRRSGVQDRHLWLLDGRVYDGQPWSAKSDMKELTAATRRMVKSYRAIAEF